MINRKNNKMSNNNLNILFNSNSINKKLKEFNSKQRGRSELPTHKISDLINQFKPNSDNKFSKDLNIHKSSFTPSNKNRDMLQPDLLLPMKSLENIKKKTLILDLDETLVHSSTSLYSKSDLTLEIDFDGIIYKIYILIRPGAQNFIKNLSKFFEIVIFTASLSKYASPLLDILDKEKNIKYRLYREHCTYLNGIYIKELKRLNRNLKDVIIVDNSPTAYTFDKENGLPIKSWYEDKNDKELEKISPLLIFLSKVDDVRDYIGLFIENNQIKYEKANIIIDTINRRLFINKEKEEDKNNKNDNIQSNDDIINQKNNIFSLHDFLSSINKNIKSNFNKNILKTNKNSPKQKELQITKFKSILNSYNNKIKIQNNEIEKTNNKSNIISNNKNMLISTPGNASYGNKKNYFRTNKKLSQISCKNLIGNGFNSNNNVLIPLTLSLTNSTKVINSKKKENNLYSLKFSCIKDATNDITLKNKLVNDYIYTNNSNNILEKIKINKFLKNKSIFLDINNKNYINFETKKNLNLTRNTKSFKLTKKKNLLIRTSAFVQPKFFPKNNNNNFIYYSSSKISRSKSTENFLKLNSYKNHPKTPKSNQRLFNYIELLDGKLSVNFRKKANMAKISQTPLRRFTPSNKPFEEKIKIKKLGFVKENISSNKN